MMPTHRFIAAVVAAATAWVGAIAQAQPTDSALVDALRAGGFNIYFRHAQTNWSQTDAIDVVEDTRSCDGAKVRQLSDEGRAASVQVGESIRALGVPVGAVLASPYCRTMETATLMGVGAVEATDDLMNLRAARFVGGRDAVIDRAKALLAATPAEGTNTILVAHGNVARNATPVYPDEAEGVVFRPDGSGGFEVVTRISPARWRELAQQFAAQ